MPLPSRRLLALLAVAALLYPLSVAAALALDGALLLAALADWWLTGGRRRLLVERRAPARLAQGAATTFELRLTNPGRFPVRAVLTDDLPPELARETDVFRVRVPGRDRAVVSYGIMPEGRGELRLGDVHARILGPLGLAWRELRERRSDPLRVHPGLEELRRQRLLGLRRRLREAGLRNIRQLGEGRSFESMREYVQGDDPRAIDWKATARHAKVMVRQYEVERSQNIVLAIDAGRLMTERIEDRSRLDHALSAALVLADVAGIFGDRVGLLVFADGVQQFMAPARATLARLADALAAVRARPAESNYPAAFAFLRRQLGRRALIVVFTDVVDARASAALVGQLSRSARRHATLAVALRNPELLARADQAAANDADAYRRAAAEELLQARGLALATMRRAGVLVADVSPGTAIADVVNQYLDAKYRGLV